MSIPSLNNLVLNNNSLLPSSHQSQLSHSHLSMHQHSSMNHGGVGMMSSAPSHPSQQQQQQQQAAVAAAKMMRVAASTGVAGVNNNMIGVPHSSHGHALSAGHFPTSNPTGQPLGIGGIGGAGNPSAANPSMTGMGGVGGANPLTTQARLYQHVLDLTVPEKRESALLELSKKREEFPELAPLLWHSFGTIASLLQEIVAIYPLLSPPRLTPMISNRCCNALALLQCVASHPETRSLFLHSHLGLFLYPFLNTVCTFRQYEYLRLTSLGVIGALVKMDDPEVISFLLQTEIIPLCLRIMDNGSELSKTVATFIIQKILLDDMGLNYICATFERFSTVASVLAKMVSGLVERPSVRLLKHIVRCYLRLSDNARAREALRSCLPTAIRDSTFAEVLKDDPTTKRWLTQLLYNIGDSLVPGLVTPNATPTVGGVGGVGLVGPASSPTDNQ